jgi:hypothetical protein
VFTRTSLVCPFLSFYDGSLINIIGFSDRVLHKLEDNMNHKANELELGHKFGLDKNFGCGEYELYDHITDSKTNIYVTLAWIAKIQYGNDSFVVSLLKSNQKNLAILLPQSLETANANSIYPVEYYNESVSSVLEHFDLVDEHDSVDFGSAAYHIDMSIYTIRTQSNFYLLSGNRVAQSQSHTDLWKAILTTCKDIIRLSKNEHLTEFARHMRWLS